MVAHKRIALALIGGFTAEFVNRIFPIIIIHYVAMKIGVERFGFAQFGIQMMDLAIFFTIFGYHTTGAVRLGRAASDKDEMRRVVWETVLLKLAHGVLAGVIVFSVTVIVSGYGQYQTLILALMFILASTVFDMSFVHLGTQRMLSLSVLTVCAKSVSLICILLFVNSPDDALLYAVLTYGANSLVSCGTVVMNAPLYPVIRVGIKRLGEMFREALPFAVTVLLLIAIDRFDLFVIEKFGGAVETGLYAAPSRLYFSTVNIIGALGAIFFSEMVGSKDASNLTSLIRMSFKVLLLMVVPISAGVWFVDADLLALVVGDSFRPAARVFSVLMLACLAHVFIIVFGFQLLQVVKRSWLLNKVLGVTLVTGIVMAVVGYQMHGMIGVAAALALAKGGASLWLLWVARRYLRRVPLDEIWKVCIPGAMMVGGLMAMGLSGLWSNILLGGAIFISSTYFLNKSDLEAILAFYKQHR